MVTKHCLLCKQHSLHSTIAINTENKVCFSCKPTPFAHQNGVNLHTLFFRAKVDKAKKFTKSIYIMLQSAHVQLTARFVFTSTRKCMVWQSLGPHIYNGIGSLQWHRYAAYWSGFIFTFYTHIASYIPIASDFTLNTMRRYIYI